MEKSKTYAVPESATNILVLNPTEFKRGYDYNFTKFIAKDYNGNQYLPWYSVVVMLQKFFPNLAIEESELDVHLAPDGAILGATVQVTVIDVNTGKVAPMHRYPIMNRDGKRSAATVLDARTVNDNRQRAYARAIAVTTGLGLRLWTREGLDVEKSDCRHILYGYMSKLTTLEAAYALNHGLPADYVSPHFGMTLAELKAYSWLADAPTV
jgi:hypothetical protein